MRAHRQALVAVLATLAAASIAAGQQAVRWQTNLDAARQMAAQSNRLLLLHFWSETCEPCARMDRDVFSRPDVAAALEANFVPVKINVRQFPMTAQQFRVTSWPTDLVVTPQGQVLDRAVGYQPPVNYLARLNQVATFARNQATSNPSHPLYGGVDAGGHSLAGQAVGLTPSAGAGPPFNYTSQPGFSVPSAPGAPTSIYPAGENRDFRSPGPDSLAATTATQPSTWQGTTAPAYTDDESTKRYGSAVSPAPAMGQSPATAFPGQSPPTAFQQASVPSSGPALSTSPIEGMPAQPRETGYSMSTPAPGDPNWPGSAPSVAGTLGANPPGTRAFGADGSGSTVAGANPTRDNQGTNLSGTNGAYAGQMGGAAAGPGPVAGLSPSTKGDDRLDREASLRSASASVASPSVSAPSSATPPRGNPPLALDGYCAVSLAEKERWVRGNPRFGVIHEGRTYLFAGPDEARRFYNDPDRYAPVASGDDVVLLAERGQRVPGRREHGAWYGGRVYLFADETSYNKFAADPARYAVARASEAGKARGYRTETSGGSLAPGRDSEASTSASNANLPASERFSLPSSSARPGDPNALRQEPAWRY